MAPTNAEKAGGSELEQLSMALQKVFMAECLDEMLNNGVIILDRMADLLILTSSRQKASEMCYSTWE